MIRSVLVPFVFLDDSGNDSFKFVDFFQPFFDFHEKITCRSCKAGIDTALTSTKGFCTWRKCNIFLSDFLDAFKVKEVETLGGHRFVKKDSGEKQKARAMFRMFVYYLTLLTAAPSYMHSRSSLKWFIHSARGLSDSV